MCQVARHLVLSKRTNEDATEGLGWFESQLPRVLVGGVSECGVPQGPLYYGRVFVQTACLRAAAGAGLWVAMRLL